MGTRAHSIKSASRTIRALGVLLIVSGLMHIAGPELLGRWLATFLGPVGEAALWLARLLGLAQCAFGVAALARPVQLAAMHMLLWASVVGFHCLAFVLPSLGACPCMGPLGVFLSGKTVHLVLILIGLTGTACGLVLWAGDSRPEGPDECAKGVHHA